MHRLFLFNKPFRVLSQFSESGEKITLKEFINVKNIYPAGRLDYDSEGLMILTNWGLIQNYITNPLNKIIKSYIVQVEGIPNKSELKILENGVNLKDGKTNPAIVKIISEPKIWERNPQIRERKNIPVSWLSIRISEGRNRQVRRMTAAIGYPALRLIRVSIGPWKIGGLKPGELKEVNCPQNYEEIKKIT